MPSWKRTYWAVWVANLTTAIGMMSFLPFFPTYLRELGLEDERAVAAWTGLIFGAAPLSAAFMSPLWGALGDRLGRKLMVVRALVAITVFVGCMGLVRSPWELLLLRVLQGVFSGFVPPSITLVSVAAPPDRQGSIAGSLQVSLGVGAVIGPLLGAFVTTRYGSRTTFLVVSTLSAASLLLVLLAAREEGERRKDGGGRLSVGGLLAASVRDLAILWRNARLRAAVVLLFWVQFGIGATNPLMELYVADLWRGDPERVPVLTASVVTLLALTTIVAMPLWGRYGDRKGHALALRRAAWWSSAGLLAHALVPLYFLLWPARVLLGGAAAGAGPATFGVAADETPVERRGGAVGAVFSARALAVSLSAMSGGFLAGLIGIRGLFAAAAVALVLVVALPRRAPEGAAEPAPSCE